MTPEQFCYWLRGILEIQTAGVDANEIRAPKLTEDQLLMVHRHLAKVFTSVVVSPQWPPDIGTGGGGGTPGLHTGTPYPFPVGPVC